MRLETALSGPKIPGAGASEVPATIGRREFVRSVTAVLSGVLGTLSPLATLVPSRAWAVDLHVLSADQSAALLAMIHTIAPHDGLDEAAYAFVISGLDTDALKSDENRTLLTTGVSGLGAEFARDPELARVKKLKAIESSPFFQSVRLKTLMVLYNNPIAWAHFGYEGEAFSKGGYLVRGFNDLKWLPEAPLSASGPMPL